MNDRLREAIAQDAAAVRTEYTRRAADPALRRYYERIAPAVERVTRHRRERTLAALDRLGRRADLRVLDAGCGDGGDLAFLAASGLSPSRLAGVDLIASALAAARQRGNRTTLAVASGADLPFADAMFDAVLQTTMLSSIVDGAVRGRVAMELARVTRAGGVIVSFDMRAVLDRNPRLVPIDRAELDRLFGAAGPMSVERLGLDLGLDSRLPRWAAAVAGRVPALRLSQLAVITRAASTDARERIM